MNTTIDATGISVIMHAKTARQAARAVLAWGCAYSAMSCHSDERAAELVRDFNRLAGFLLTSSDWRKTLKDAGYPVAVNSAEAQ